jgi:hypothetical protein
MYCKANAKFVNDGFFTGKNGALILQTAFFCTACHEMVRNQACVHQNRERGLGVMGASDNCDARFCADEEWMRVGKNFQRKGRSCASRQLLLRCSTFRHPWRSLCSRHSHIHVHLAKSQSCFVVA